MNRRGRFNRSRYIPLKFLIHLCRFILSNKLFEDYYTPGKVDEKAGEKAGRENEKYRACERTRPCDACEKAQPLWTSDRHMPDAQKARPASSQAPHAVSLNPQQVQVLEAAAAAFRAAHAVKVEPAAQAASSVLQGRER